MFDPRVDLNLSTEKMAVRQSWMRRRLAMEKTPFKYHPTGKRFPKRRPILERNIRLFGKLLKTLGLYERGFRNAATVRLKTHVLSFDDLPPVFDGFRILHMTDPHLDYIPGTEKKICEIIRPLHYDLCVMTGDYRLNNSGPYRQVLGPMKMIAETLQAPCGIYATLGNHDTCRMLEDMEALGIKCLANETVRIHRKDASICLTGIDDVHCYYTIAASRAISDSGKGFKIAAVHSPELYAAARKHEYRLYLCGHSHGGQICLPGGVPVITHLHSSRRFYRGLWRSGHMIGYTNCGCGTVGLPLRFNTQSEVALIELRSPRH